MSVPRKKRLTPSEKKRLSLQRDRIQDVENPKAFRKLWPRKKARTKRANRRVVRQVLVALPPEESDQAIKSRRPKRAKKWSGTAVPLGTMIEERHRRREARAGGKARRRRKS
jgi:hypothetical protein